MLCCYSTIINNGDDYQHAIIDNSMSQSILIIRSQQFENTYIFYLLTNKTVFFFITLQLHLMLWNVRQTRSCYQLRYSICRSFTSLSFYSLLNLIWQQKNAARHQDVGKVTALSQNVTNTDAGDSFHEWIKECMCLHLPYKSPSKRLL